MNEYYMNVALKQAKKALKNNEVPVGAIVVYKNKIIAKAFNKKEKTKNATMHAEIIAIKKACKKIKNWRLNDCVMYVTMEPCNMCMGAIIESRIKKIYCGIRNNKSQNINDLIVEKEKINIEYFLLKSECEKILESFFHQLRDNQTNVR